MKHFFILSVVLCVAHVAQAQFRAGISLGFNNTVLGQFDDPETDVRFKPKQQVTIGLDAEWVFRGKLKPVYFSVGSGLSYLKNGYQDGTYYTSITGEQRPVISNYETRYLQIPLIFRLFIQPQPLEENFSFFVGAGISNHILFDASLYELTVEETFGFGINTYEDNRNIKNYGEKSYLFSTIEAGIILNRARVTFRYKKSLQDMYFSGLNKNWNVPTEFSIYKSVYNSSGKLTERHIELSVTYFIFK
jgi:hypothetical protein